MAKKINEPKLCECCGRPLTEDTNHDEKLRIGPHEKRHFPERDYYHDWMEKIVWEEED